MNNKQISWSIIIVVIIIVFASVAYALTQKPSITPQPRVTPQPELPQPNATSTAQQTPPPVVTGGLNLTVTAAIAQAEGLNDQQVCIRGAYQSSFEFTALGSGFSAEGYLQKPYIWVGVPVDESKLNCKKSPVGQVTCQAETTICGLFQSASANEKGFGHVAAYRYQLTLPITSPPNNQLQTQ